MARKETIYLYTDGAASGNPGPGGWGAVLICGNLRKELSGGFARTTNNRMELFAAISGLGALKEPCNVNLYSDSNYLVQAFNEHWIDNWMKNGWTTGSPRASRKRRTRTCGCVSCPCTGSTTCTSTG